MIFQAPVQRVLCPGRLSLQAFRSLLLALFCVTAAHIAGAASVTLAWDANSETNLVGYRLYFGAASRSYPTHVDVSTPSTSVTVSNLVAGSNYFFAVTAFCDDGLESDYSSEISYRVPLSGTNTNAAPIAFPRSETMSEDQALALTLTGSDTNGDALTFTVVTLPLNGTVSGTPPNLTYRPATNYSGSDSLSFRVSDGRTSSAPATISITIVPVNDPPTLAPFANVTINEDAGPQAISLAGITTGAANEVQPLAVTATSSNPALVPNPTVSYSSPNATGGLNFTPVANASGTATITVTVNDGQPLNNLVTRTFTVTVTPVNDPPTLAAPPNLSLPWNAPQQTVTLSGISAGPADESQALTVTAVSSNPSLIPHPSVAYTSPNPTATLSFTPVTNASGTATISVTVNDGQVQNSTLTRSFSVTVVAGNQAPTLGALADVTVNEDAALQTVTLTGITAGAPTETQALTVGATSSNPSLIPTPTVTYASPDPTGTLTFTPTPNAYGTATITVTVDDGQPLNHVTTRSFQITVAAINDAPTLAPIANAVVNEDSGLQAVVLSGITAGATNEGQTLVVGATSSNPALIPNPTVSYTSPNATGTLSFAPAANAVGTATITVTVSDGQATNGTATRTFNVTVTPVNDPPTLATLANLTVSEDAGAQTVALSGITAGPANEAQNLMVTATSSNPSLVPPPTVQYTSPNATGTVTLSLIADAFGTSTITVTVNDGQSTNNTVTRTFTVTVTPVNDAPTLAPLAGVSLPPDAPTQMVALSGITAGAANEAQPLSVTATSSNPGLIPQPSVTYSSPNSTGSLGFTPIAGASGSALITVTVNDGQAQSNTFSRSFTVTVTAGNQAPTLNAIADVAINENAPEQVVNLTGITSGAVSESQTLTVTATSSQPSLIPNPTVHYTSPAAAASLTFTPVARGFGSAQIAVTVDDGQPSNHALTRWFTVTVNPINDPPTLNPIANVSFDEDTGSHTVALTGLGTGATNESQTLAITAVSSNPGLLPDPILHYESPATSGSLVLAPITNAVGSATITVTVNDGASAFNTVVRSFDVFVRAVNDAPVVSVIPDQHLAAGTSSGLLPFTVEDVDTPLASVNLLLSSSNPTLLPPSGLVLGGSGANRTLTITPAANASGVSVVTLIAHDGSATNRQTIQVTVAPPNQAPLISAVADQVMDGNTTLAAVAFQVSDAETPAADLTVTAVSYNPAVLPDNGIELGGTGTNRTISLTPADGRSGEVTIGLTVGDGSQQAQRTFRLQVRPVRSTLTIVRNGSGTVSPDLHGQALVVGAEYTVIAKPGTGEMFESWGGDVSSTSATLTFTMRSNLVIAANFATDALFAAQGSYNGLIAEQDAVRHDTSGSFALKTTSRGTYSARLQVGSGKFSVAGLLDRAGRATNVVLRPGRTPLRLEMTVDLHAQPARVDGRVSDGSWSAVLAADRQVYHARTNPAPYRGTYTMVLPPDAEAAAGPDGYSYGTIRVDGSGMILLVGMLADGTKVTQKVPVSASGQWPFYVSLYRSSGSALGWLNFDHAQGVLSGLASWIKPSVASKYYAGGFTNEASATGSTWVAPTGPELLAAARATLVECAGANLSADVFEQLLVGPKGRAVAPGRGVNQFSFSPATGLFKGTVLDPATHRPRSFTGVLLQKWNVGAGLILGLNEVGAVEIAHPESP